MSQIGNIVQAALTGNLKEAILKTGVDQALAALISVVPIFGWPVINPLTRWALKKLISFLLDKTILGVNTVWIEVENKNEVDAVKKASAELQELPDNAPQEVVDEKVKAWEDAARDLIRIKTKRL